MDSMTARSHRIPIRSHRIRMAQEPLITRRRMIAGIHHGLGGLAFTELLHRTAGVQAAAAADFAPHGLHPKAKRIIFLFMHGGPSHLDTFDYKPELLRCHGQALPFEKPRIQFAQTGNLLRSPWEFRQYGNSGTWVSDLFPHVARHADDLTFVHSLFGSNEAHGGALLKLHTGSDTFVRPSMGAWISYGLGTENENLPSFVTINPTLGHGGVRNFGSAFLPPIHQGTRIGSSGVSLSEAKIEFLQPPAATSVPLQQSQLALLEQLAAQRASDRGYELDEKAASRLRSFELAFRMQAEAPNLLSLSGETQETLDLYGIGKEPTDNFGRECLLARRLSEAGVRFVQASHAYWDQHAELREKHQELAAQVDFPIAGLLTDLKRRGLLDETLVIWGGELGRTPTAQGDNGRDHNPHAFTWWFAGGGMKPGLHYGASDEFGFYAYDNKVHVHDLHATLLAALGIDHEELTYRYGGRDFRLTDVEGRVISELFA